MADLYDIIVEKRARQQARNQRAQAGVDAIRYGSPTMSDYVIGALDTGIDRYADMRERARARQDKEATAAAKKQEREDKAKADREQFLLGQTMATKRAYGLAMPELGIGARPQRTAQMRPFVDMVTGEVHDPLTGEVKFKMAPQRVKPGTPTGNNEFSRKNQIKNAAVQAAKEELKRHKEKWGILDPFGKPKGYKPGHEPPDFLDVLKAKLAAHPDVWETFYGTQTGAAGQEEKPYGDQPDLEELEAPGAKPAKPAITGGLTF